MGRSGGKRHKFIPLSSDLVAKKGKEVSLVGMKGDPSSSKEKLSDLGQFRSDLDDSFSSGQFGGVPCEDDLKLEFEKIHQSLSSASHGLLDKFVEFVARKQGMISRPEVYGFPASVWPPLGADGGDKAEGSSSLKKTHLDVSDLMHNPPLVTCAAFTKNGAVHRGKSMADHASLGEISEKSKSHANVTVKVGAALDSGDKALLDKLSSKKTLISTATHHKSYAQALQHNRNGRPVGRF